MGSFSSGGRAHRRLYSMALGAVLIGFSTSADAQLDLLKSLRDPKAALNKTVHKEVDKDLGSAGLLRFDVHPEFDRASDGDVGFKEPNDATVINSPDDLKMVLKPGNYAVAVMAYAIFPGFHEPPKGQPYVLGRAQGKFATPISQLLTSSTLKKTSANDVNAAFWRIVDGVPFDSLQDGDKKLIRDNAPDLEPVLKTDYIHSIKSAYDRFKVVPGVDSFEEVLAKDPPLGIIAAHLFAAREKLVDKDEMNSNLPQLLWRPLPDNQPRKPDLGDAPPPVWGQALPGVYVRLQIYDGVRARNYLEVHVSDNAGGASGSPTLADVLGATDRGASIIGYPLGEANPEALPTPILLAPMLGS